MGLGGLLTVFGVMHSPLAGDKMFFPTDLMNADVFSPASIAAVRDFAIAYFVMAVILLVMDRITVKEPVEEVQH
jgi:AGZA family xanthine/uracil permease-like MFS transporter